jgi:hypothetical protein
MWRDGIVRLERHGLLRRPPSLVLPAVMRMVRSGSASDIPRTVTVSGRQGDDEVRLRFDPDDYVRVVVPDERDDLGTVVLDEVGGRVAAQGTIGGRVLDLEGSGVFEFLR